MSIIALSGNPNCGKTTLFNRLTNSRARVGNRAGVTVAPKRGSWGSHTLVDLPGIYSLEGSAAEERAAKSYIKSDKPERILNIIDATDLERSLWLTVQLANMQLPMTVALNMSDCLEREGYSIDIKTLAKRLGVPVILISASSGAGVHELAAAGACVPNKIPSPRSWIAETVELVLKKEGEGRLKKSIAADRILLGKFTALPILTAAFAIIFLLTFGSLGRGLGDVFERVYSGFEAFIQGFLIDLEVNPFLYGLICDGLIKAAGSVVPFFGQIIILFFLLSILEDVGYMSRVVFITDRVMERAGLDGRAVLPLITGFGCSVPAVMTAQNIDDREKRKRTIKLLPFVSCSAKMPVYIIFAGAFFPVHQGAAAAALYFLGLGAAAVYAFFQKRYAQKDTAPFVMELPPYRCPTLKNTLNRLWG